MKPLLSVTLLAFACTQPAPAREPEVARILEKYRAARPSDEKLAFYALDWAPSLAEARARARKEGRPIFFIWLTNITAATSFFTGHC
jgi:hypothetical protein